MIESNVEELKDVLRKESLKFAPKSPELRQAFIKIGLLVTGRTKTNIRIRNLIDTGRLLNSIRYEFFEEIEAQGIRIGSFGVPYASVHEFGFDGSVSIKSYIRKGGNVRAHTRQGSKVRAHTRESAQIRAHKRDMKIKARPFLIPAIEKSRNEILEILTSIRK